LEHSVCFCSDGSLLCLCINKYNLRLGGYNRIAWSFRYPYLGTHLMY
jgi:hypothetical protein